MSDQTATSEKSIVDQLSFGAKTVKRVTWEAWEFTIVGPYLVEVTNASYGFEKDDHAYAVGVEKRNGLIVPSECECPADLHQDDDCKHKVALAAIGGKTVLDAAVNYSTRERNSLTKSITVRDKLRTDGGKSTREKQCPNGDSMCPGPNPDDDELPCFDCYMMGV
ncbi:SWIM zinc finger family protein [Haladaptatus sp. NG-WS-4]